MIKKIIIICAFSLWILVTAIYTIVSAVDSYNFDMENGVDIFEGFDAALITMIGGFIVFYEFDLFYTVYYFFIKPKTIIESVLNVFSNVSLLLIFVYGVLSSRFMQLRAFAMTTDVLLFVYVVLRNVYCIISVRALEQKQ